MLNFQRGGQVQPQRTMARNCVVACTFKAVGV